jgi:hypothetical protein
VVSLSLLDSYFPHTFIYINEWQPRRQGKTGEGNYSHPIISSNAL